VTSVTASLIPRNIQFELVALRESMLSGRITRATIRILDWISGRISSLDNIAEHIRTGRGEEDAYFYLRRNGHIIVARNFCSPNRCSEIDLIGWHKDVLCFVEAKTRKTPRREARGSRRSPRKAPGTACRSPRIPPALAAFLPVAS
jgi:hypothetical protein